MNKSTNNLAIYQKYMELFLYILLFLFLHLFYILMFHHFSTFPIRHNIRLALLMFHYYNMLFYMHILVSIQNSFHLLFLHLPTDFVYYLLIFCFLLYLIHHCNYTNLILLFHLLSMFLNFHHMSM